MASSIPAFSSRGDRYDQNEWAGRARKNVDVVDPRTLLPSVFYNKTLDAAMTELSAFREDPERARSRFGDESLWTAKKVVDAQVHPQTGEKIFAPFRMSGFVPFGTPIVVGMLLTSSSPLASAFFQFLNQSHNAGVNYANRNASADASSGELFTSYVAACSAAMTTAVVGDAVAKRVRTPIAARFVPFFAVASANVVNVSAMRRSELHKGIDVVDEDGVLVGVSKRAAKKALVETAVTRVLLPIPVLVLSPLLMVGVERAMPAVLTRTALRIAIQSAVVTATFMCGLPLSMAVFKQTGELVAEDVEKVSSYPNEIPEIVYYNKGL